jgi:dUTP pyrophosphatase
MAGIPEEPALKVWFLREKLAVLPSYASDGAAGLDLHAALEEELRIEPGERSAVPTGLAMAIPDGYEGQVRPRSGLAKNYGVTVANAPGTVDSDYRGEVQVLLVNLGREAYTVRPRDRIAQLVIAPVTRVCVQQLEDAEELGATTRGAGGFGSTGR